MIKRAIILILILAGLYWITSAFRDGDGSNIQKEVEKKVAEVKTDEAKKSSKGESDENEKVEDTKSAKSEDTKITITKKVETPKKEVEIKVETTQKAVVAPTVKRTYTKVVKKVPVTPTVPDRTTYVKVYMYEWGIDLSSKKIPSGTVVFTVINSGRFSHDFTIKGLKDFGKVAPRQTVSFTSKVPAGNYEIFSGRRDDTDNGMREGLTVSK